MSADALEVACPATPRDLDRYDVDAPLVESRDICGQCFPDGIPGHIEVVVIGQRYTSSVHLPENRSDDVDHDPKVTSPDDPRNDTNGLAVKIGAEDFGPEDLGLDPTGGGEA